MKNIIRLEEMAMFMVSIVALYSWNVPWYFYLLLVLGPDISMLGYLAGNKVGAVCYNTFHHKGLAILIFVTGLIFDYDVLVFAGIIVFGHSSMDRFFGYGLKLPEGFKFTHLGMIGKK